MTAETRKSRTLLILWIVLMGILALGLLAVLVSAALTATILVDEIPGGDAGLATSPSLEAAYQTMNWSLWALVASVVVGVAVPLLTKAIRHRSLRPHQA